MGWAARVNQTAQAVQSELLFNPAFLRACAKAMAQQPPPVGRRRIFIDTQGRQVRGAMRADGSIEWTFVESGKR